MSHRTLKWLQNYGGYGLLLFSGLILVFAVDVLGQSNSWRYTVPYLWHLTLFLQGTGIAMLTCDITKAVKVSLQVEATDKLLDRVLQNRSVTFLIYAYLLLGGLSITSIFYIGHSVLDIRRSIPYFASIVSALVLWVMYRNVVRWVLKRDPVFRQISNDQDSR